MLILKKIHKRRKIFILLISIVITSCSVNDKKGFDLIYEARKLIANIADEDKINESIKQIEQKKIIQKEDKKSENEKLDKSAKEVKKKISNFSSEKSPQLKEEYSKKPEISESTLIKRNKKNIKKQQTINRTTEMQKIQIGVLLPLTGENREIGNAILNALELALFQADNKNINLIIEDTKADPETTKKIFNKLTKKNIKFFVGPLYSESLASVESYAPQQKVKFFALTNNSNLAKNGVWVF